MIINKPKHIFESFFIEKGIYKDNPFNRKKGRVGQHYGSDGENDKKDNESASSLIDSEQLYNDLVDKSKGFYLTGINFDNSLGDIKDNVKEFSKYDQAFFVSYTGYDYMKVNYDLRRKNPHELAIKYRDKMNELVNKLPKFDGTVYRGMAFENETTKNRFLETILNKAKETDNTFEFDTLTSTTKNKAETEGFIEGAYNSIILKIESNKGGDLSLYSTLPEEEEVLFPSTTKFSFDRFEEDEKGITTIVLKTK